jgi:hypothetical protein
MLPSLFILDSRLAELRDSAFPGDRPRRDSARPAGRSDRSVTGILRGWLDSARPARLATR